MGSHNRTSKQEKPPSTKNIQRQSYLDTSQPEIGLVRTVDRGKLARKTAFARPISLLGNQLPTTISNAGYIPPSATPRRNRIPMSCAPFCTKPVRIETAPMARRSEEHTSELQSRQ